MNDDLRSRVKVLSETPVLLVCADYDGTLAPFVDTPAAAAPDPRCLEAVHAISTLPHTATAILSGRAVVDLRRLGRFPDSITIIGGHGAESDGALPTPEQRDLLDALEAFVSADAIPAGLRVERKPFGITLHYRAAGPERAAPVLHRVLTHVGSDPRLTVRRGNMILEFAASPADKGAALRALRRRTGATGVLFLGDDLTDEDAFRVLTPGDLGVKVGEGETVTSLRVADPGAVADLLHGLIGARRAWLGSRRLVPLQNLSILSDQRTIVVAGPDARLVWACAPRIDSSSLFAELVGGPDAGFFDVRPAPTPDTAPPAPLAQHYDADSFVLVTEWNGLTVTDYLDCSGGRAFQRAGRSDLLRVVKGTAPFTIRFAPRLDFGRSPTRLLAHDSGLVVEGSPEPVVLHAPGVAWTITDHGPHQTATATVTPTDQPLVLELRLGSGSLRDSIVTERDRRRQTLRFWSGWAGALTLPTLHRDTVKRSALVLKALSHGPTGAIAAAATTSLPEHLGGSRNWDYRFCWPRDACVAAAALLRLGNTGHALKLLDWILAVVDACETPDRLRPIYTVTGRHLPPEAELSNLSGYGGSRPVRISNAAANQVQLDVFGPIVDLVAMLAERGAPVSPDHWRLVRAMVNAVEVRWHEPDHGIWELRTERRQHVHSKVMCWHTVHRALLVEDYVFGRRSPAWTRLADEIRADVLARGWSERRASFTGSYGLDSLDAATLSIGLTGMLPPDNDRFIATVDAVNTHLRVGPGVYRYLDDDGLEGPEGAMLICTGWLIESLHLVGRTAEARELLDALVALAGPTGIATEQFEPRQQLNLGNIAQAYTHAAIINACIALSGPIAPPPAE